MRIGDFFHLTYCTNIHPGETWGEVFANLQAYLPAIQADVAHGRSTGIGLRLSQQAANELLAGDHLARFRDWLVEHALYVFTLNGFPYGGFHGQIVKENVYAPDWSQHARFDYTLALAHILAGLLPPGMDGSISTLPLSYRPWHSAAEQQRQVLARSCHYLAETTRALARIEQSSGRCLHVDLEPEPDCLLQDSQDVLAFFNDWLVPAGARHLAERMRIDPAQGEELIRRHIRLCFDTCHFAVVFERADAALARLEQAGIRIGKIQISSALKVRPPHSDPARRRLIALLAPFAESTYLHQVVERNQDGALCHYPDLAQALPALARSDGQEWRVHFHVPVFIGRYGPFESTQEELSSALATIQARRLCPHLEIETYTWGVLPERLKQDLLSSIKREYSWVMEQIGQS